MGFRAFRNVFGALALLGVGTLASGAGVLELPSEAGESGIGLIAGWHCTAQSIEIQVDQGPLIKAGTGTLRPDTASACGHANTGFGLTYNYNVHAPGSHTVSAYSDGVLFAKRFLTTFSYGVEYLQGAEAAFLVPDFPKRGVSTLVSWSEAKQNFSITQIQPSSTTAARPNGTWLGSARTSAIELACNTGDLPFDPQAFSEAAATAAITVDRDEVMLVTLETNKGACRLRGPLGGSSYVWHFMADLPTSDLSCLGSPANASWTHVSTLIVGAPPVTPTVGNDLMVNVTIRAYAQAQPGNCEERQWIAMHGAKEPR
jgi:hypothetical protein